jgi:hypothetical protein
MRGRRQKAEWNDVAGAAPRVTIAFDVVGTVCRVILTTSARTGLGITTSGWWLLSGRLVAVLGVSEANFFGFDAGLTTGSTPVRWRFELGFGFYKCFVCLENRVRYVTFLAEAGFGLDLGWMTLRVGGCFRAPAVRQLCELVHPVCIMQ